MQRDGHFFGDGPMDGPGRGPMDGPWQGVACNNKQVWHTIVNTCTLMFFCVLTIDRLLHQKVAK